MPNLDFSLTEASTKIILQTSDHAQEFKQADLVHKREFELLIKLIDDALKLAKAFPEKKHLHNTITLLGTRGSGKTSFLLSVIKWIDDEKNVDLSPVQVLEIIDPTLIEEKGHVFLNVISLIADLVDKKLDKKECDPHEDKPLKYSRKEWRSSLNKLAAGLPSIDGIGTVTSDSWQDPEFVMDIGLKAVAASQKLSKNFNEFLKISLNILEKKAFLLIFDDIDVDASKGWAVLETIRKYFTGSQLITLISGDLELYTTVVRQKKWKNFGAEILKYEGTEQKKDGLKEFESLTTKLTAQYMLKIMQPKYRIHLSSLMQRKLTRNRLDIMVAKNEHSDSIDLETAYYTIFRNYGIVNSITQEVYRTFILSRPLRTQIQLLTLLHEQADGNVVDNNALADIFLTDLLEQRVDINFAANTPKFLLSAVLELLLKNRVLEDLYQLLPTSINENVNASLFSLSLMLSNTARGENRFVIFDYFIKIAYLRNLMTVIPYPEKRKSENSFRPNIKDLTEKVSILNDGVLRDTTGRIQTYLYGVLELEGNVGDINPFFIQLKGLETFAKRGYTDRIDVVFSNASVSKAERILGNIPCFIGSFGFKNASRIGYSFYLLLGAIGDIVKAYETDFKYLPNNTKSGMMQLLKDLSQLRSYPIISFSKVQSDGAPQGDVLQVEALIQDNLEDQSDQELADAIIKWLESYKSFSAASHLLGKITTRFFYAMKNIVEVGTSDVLLGAFLHRQVVSFMNSVLIEETKERLPEVSSQLNLNNTNTDDGIFINNIRMLINNDRENPFKDLIFSKWILSCPLFYGYLQKDLVIRLDDLIRRFFGSHEVELDYTKFSVFTLLNQVSIRSHGEQSNEGSITIVQGTPRLLKTPAAVVERLISANIPFEWFKDTDDRSQARERNSNIREYVSSIFGNDKLTSQRVRKFRTFLKTRNVKW